MGEEKEEREAGRREGVLSSSSPLVLEILKSDNDDTKNKPAQVFAFDEVLSTQRRSLYATRSSLLEADDKGLEQALRAAAVATLAAILPNFVLPGKAGINGTGLVNKAHYALSPRIFELLAPIPVFFFFFFFFFKAPKSIRPQSLLSNEVQLFLGTTNKRWRSSSPVCLPSPRTPSRAWSATKPWRRSLPPSTRPSPLKYNFSAI